MPFFLLLFLLTILGISAQTNPFPPNSPEHGLYALYLTCSEKRCADQLPAAAALFDRNPKPIMATELFYNYFVSIACYFQEDYAMAEFFAKENEALLEEYEHRRILFWDEEDFRYLNGMEKLDLKRLHSWNGRVIGTKPLPTTKTICPSCPIFPFPPPHASAQTVLEKDLFNNCKTLADASQKISRALENCAYDRRYYAIPGGFAIAARLEQFSGKDAAPLQEPDRWAVTLPPVRSFSDYLQSFIFGQEGNFRIIVFVVTDQPFNQNSRKITREEAIDWLRSGLNILPDDFVRQKWTPAYNCTALIYEFKVKSAKLRAVMQDNSVFPARRHLDMARLLSALQQAKP